MDCRGNLSLVTIFVLGLVTDGFKEGIPDLLLFAPIYLEDDRSEPIFGDIIKALVLGEHDLFLNLGRHIEHIRDLADLWKRNTSPFRDLAQAAAFFFRGLAYLARKYEVLPYGWLFGNLAVLTLMLRNSLQFSKPYGKAVSFAILKRYVQDFVMGLL